MRKNTADVQDLNPPLYSSYHLSFTSTLPRPLLEELASLILTNDPTGQTGQLISSVHDQFLDFLVPSPSLFSLLPRRETVSQPNGASKKGALVKDKEVPGKPSYVVLNQPKAVEEDIMAEVERIAKGLFSVIVTMGIVPIIRAPRDNAAEMVARQLDTKLREHIASTSSQRGGAGFGGDSLQRPCESLSRHQLTMQCLLSWIAMWTLFLCSLIHGLIRHLCTMFST